MGFYFYRSEDGSYLIRSYAVASVVAHGKLYRFVTGLPR